MWQVSRDHARTPMQWTSGDHAGFTTGTPWMRVNENAGHINVEQEQKDPLSVLHFYKKLIALRHREPLLKEGTLAFIDTPYPKQLIAYRRQKGNRSLLFVANLSDNACPIPFPLPEKEPLLTSWERELSPRPAGQLRPYEAMLWEE